MNPHRYDPRPAGRSGRPFWALSAALFAVWVAFYSPALEVYHLLLLGAVVFLVVGIVREDAHAV